VGSGRSGHWRGGLVATPNSTDGSIVRRSKTIELSGPIVVPNRIFVIMYLFVIMYSKEKTCCVTSVVSIFQRHEGRNRETVDSTRLV